MENYTIQTWLALFFIYSFFGWIWEVCYVSFHEKKLVNRGFLTSPILPIYGFGALMVLRSTLPVENNLILIYIFGAIGATILEVITGYLMEVLFKTRYWDYSSKKIHYKGYICLSSTIAWGFFSIIMVKYINVPVENFIFGLNTMFLEVATLILLVVFSVDVTKSVRDALDLKELLETMANNNQRVNALVNEMESISASFEENKEDLKAHIEDIRNEVKNREVILFEKISDSRSKFDIKLKLSNVFDKVTDSLNDAENKVIEEEHSKREIIVQQLRNLKNKIEDNKYSVRNLELRRFKGAINQLKRNTSAKSKHLKDELEKIKDL